MAMEDVYLVLSDESTQMHDGFGVESSFTRQDMGCYVVLLTYFGNFQMRIPKIMKNSHH